MHVHYCTNTPTASCVCPAQWFKERQHVHNSTRQWYLVCTALHPEITRRLHCSKFSVAPLWIMNVTKQQHSPAAYQLFLIHTGELASCRAATAPPSQSYTVTMCLRIHLPVFVDNLHGRQRVVPLSSLVSRSQIRFLNPVGRKRDKGLATRDYFQSSYCSQSRSCKSRT